MSEQIATRVVDMLSETDGTDRPLFKRVLRVARLMDLEPLVRIASPTELKVSFADGSEIVLRRDCLTQTNQGRRQHGCTTLSRGRVWKNA